MTDGFVDWVIDVRVGVPGWTWILRIANGAGNDVRRATRGVSRESQEPEVLPDAGRIQWLSQGDVCEQASASEERVR